MCALFCAFKKTPQCAQNMGCALWKHMFHVFATCRHMWLFRGLDKKLGSQGLNPGSTTVKCVTLNKLLNLSEPPFLHQESLPSPQGPQHEPLPTSPDGAPSPLCSFSKLQPHWPPFCSSHKPSLVQPRGLCTGYPATWNYPLSVSLVIGSFSHSFLSSSATLLESPSLTIPHASHHQLHSLVLYSSQLL